MRKQVLSANFRLFCQMTSVHSSQYFSNLSEMDFAPLTLSPPHFVDMLCFLLKLHTNRVLSLICWL